MITQNDLDSLRARGIDSAQIDLQVARFKTGFPVITISRPATLGDGIVSLGESDFGALLTRFDEVDNVKIVRFAPASGAATRMMKEMFEFAESDKESQAVDTVFEKIGQFPFYNDLVNAGVDMSDKKAVVKAILFEPLEYGKYPKGVIKFHNAVGGQTRTPICEQLIEAAVYGVSKTDGKGETAHMHFTVSGEHLALFEAEVAAYKESIEKEFGVKLDVSYSTQKASTDTIAVSLDNEPMRKACGELLMRPAGHGALIENLNDIDADMIFVKTIDNVQPEKYRKEATNYKKAIGAFAIDVQKQINEFIADIDNGTADPEVIIAFVEDKLGYRFGEATNFEHLRSLLNRPVRVCGMVKNEGEPGGGPFWVVADDGSMSLQILESSQIADDDKHLMKDATHFNPVDLVCLVRDSEGIKFDLRQYVDADAGFISEKSYEGKALKAMELPGLWNGAMANWNTLFVEVPMVTFSPVKTIVDLLRPEHQ